MDAEEIRERQWVMIGSIFQTKNLSSGYVSTDTLPSSRPRSLSTAATPRFHGERLSETMSALEGDHMECQICLENRPLADFPTGPITRKCGHENECCNTCLSQSIATSFEGNMWDDIRCPVCNEDLEFQDISTHAPRHVFER
jgi:hypothetical protein